MTDANEVKANVKLLFQNRSGRTCVAVRSLQVTKKRTKLEFKALEGVLKTKDANGSTVSTSMKCSDMDRIIPENLGVSPAILENVIFVHQEDSSWPMQEGKVLKTKFDDIFESTRYTKALEALTKTKKDMQNKAKNLKGELMELGAHLLAATQSRKELDATLMNKTSCEEELAGIATRLQQNDERLRKVTDVINAAQANMRHLQKLEWQVNDADRRVQEKSNSLESKLSETDDELQHILNNFEAAMSAKTRELQGLNQQMEAVAKETERMRVSLNELNLKKGQAVAVQDQIAQNREAQLQVIQRLSRKLPCLNHVQCVTTWSAAIVRDVLQRLQAELQTLQGAGMADVLRLREAVAVMEKTASDKKNDMQTVEMELKFKGDEARGLQQELHTKRMELSKIAASKGTVQRCQLDYDGALRTHDEFLETYQTKANDYKKQLKEVSDGIRDLQEELARDAQLLQELGHHRNEIAAVEASIKQTDADLSMIHVELNSVRGTNRDVLRDILLEEPTTPNQLEASLKLLETQTAEKNSQRDHTREQSSRMKAEVATKEAMLVQHNNKLQVLRQKIEAMSEVEREKDGLIARLNELRSGKVLGESEFPQIEYAVSFEELLQKAKETEDEARELLTIAKAGKAYMKRLNRDRKKKPNVCPCCEQTLNSPAAIEILDRNIRSVFTLGGEGESGTIEEHEEVLRDSAQIFTTLQSMQMTLIPAIEVRQELSQLERTIQDLSLAKGNQQRDLRALESTQQETDLMAQNFARVTRALQDLLLRWKNAEQRRNDLADRKRRQTESLFSGDLGERSLEDVETLQRTRQEDKDRLQTRKDKLANEESSFTKRFYAVKNNLSEKEKALSDARLEGSRSEELETAVQALQVKLTENEARKAVLTRNRDNIDRELAEFNIQLSGRRGELRKSEDQHQQEVLTLKKDQESITKLSESLDLLERRYADMDLDAVDTRLAEIQENITSKEAERKSFLPRISALNAELASQEHIKRNVLGNIELRANVLELQQLREELRSYEVQQGGSAQQFKAAEKEQQAAQRERQSLNSERDTLNGRVEVFRAQCAQIEKKLNESTYRGVEERHRRKNIEHETTHMAVADLDNYYNAL